MGKGSAPPPPDYAAANREGILTGVELLPLQKQIEAAAKMGTKISYKDPRTGETKEADFTGAGDADQMRSQIGFMTEAADALAKSQLESQQKYGLGYVEQRSKELEAADPLGTKMRKALGEDIYKEGFGTNLSKSQEDQVTQAERGAQAARGNIFGGAPAAAEAMAVGDAGFRMRQQRLANASAFLSGTTPVAQFGQISGAQQGASAWNPMGIQQGMGLNANAGQMGSQFAMNSYSGQLDSWKAEQANSPLGMIGGAVLGGITGGLTGGLTKGIAGGVGKMFCWVAREVFGQSNPEWLQFRDWLETCAPRWFFRLYNAHGERFAAWIADKPILKSFIRRWMRARIAKRVMVQQQIYTSLSKL